MMCFELEVYPYCTIALMTKNSVINQPKFSSAALGHGSSHKNLDFSLQSCAKINNNKSTEFTVNKSY